MLSKKILLERVEKWLSPIYWTDVNIRSALFGVAVEVKDLTVFHADGDSRPHISAILPLIDQFLPISVGASFTSSWSTKWFHFHVVIPEHMNGKKVCLRWDSSSEAMIYDSDGNPLQAFTGGGGGDRRDMFIVAAEAKAGMHLSYWVEMACNEMFGNGDGGMIQPPASNKTFTLRTVEVVAVRQIAHDLFWDMTVLLDLAQALPDCSPTADAALALMTCIINSTNLHDDASLFTAHEMAKRFFDSGSACKVDHDIYALGHCHIDTAWLWPYAETRRKVVRSWITQCDLLRRYPAYRFVASQTVQFEWLGEDHPDVLTDIEALVRAGKFIPVGGSYVEFDAYMPSGESMVRQFLYGMQFMKQRFDVRPRVFWLPDTFGYSSQLPQLMRGFGMKYFLSQKLSWNLLNKFPHHTFEWEGIDGSSVIAHFPPGDSYGAEANPSDIIKSANNHKSKCLVRCGSNSATRDRLCSNRSILLFGHGDGGGGPAVSHLEKLSRMAPCAALARIHMESSPEEFFAEVEKDFDRSRSVHSFSTEIPRHVPYPVWVGELYLELHQGSLTSQALIKKQNRDCEVHLRALDALHVLLLVSAAMHNLTAEQRAYCHSLRGDIKTLWKDTLLNQFHDVLPGTSIACVYEDSNRILAGVLRECSRHIQKLIDILSSFVSTSGDADTCWAFNSCSYDRWYSYVEGEVDAMKVVSVKGFALASIPRSILPAISAPSPLLLHTGPECGNGPSGDLYIRELPAGCVLIGNSAVEVELSASGLVISLRDKRMYPPREVLYMPAGPRSGNGNHYVLYDDIPFYWDAWDVMPYHQMTGRSLNGENRVPQVEVSSTVIAVDPRAISVQFVLSRWGEVGTDITTTVTVSSNSPLIEFSVNMNWHEKHKLLKVEFPLAVRSSVVRCETQFGHTERPTHSNQPTDAAMFEICGHKYADLSEVGYGVALLNDCKYGYSCRGSTLCLSLLRAPKAPDEHCDMGKHSLRYALLPHVGSILECGVGRDVVLNAALFNSPLMVSSNPERSYCADQCETVSTDVITMLTTGLCGLMRAGGLVIDSMKAAEDDNGRSGSDIIIRLYESVGSRGTAFLYFNAHVTLVELCDMNEERIDDLSLDKTSEFPRCGIYVNYLPFQIISLRVRPI